METIAIDLVYKFALELQKLLDTLEKEFGRDLYRGKPKHKVIERANELTKKLYNDYKITFDLTLHEENGEYDLEFKNSYNNTILVPKSFLESKNYQEVKQNLDVNILLMKRNLLSWEDFIFQLTHSLVSIDIKTKYLSLNILERLRFFMTFINEFPNYITETPVPLEAKKNHI